MPLKAYGVLTARPIARVREGGTDSTPHYQIHLRDDAGVEYRAAVNVKSQETPSELLYAVFDAFSHPMLEGLSGLPSGWTPLTPGPAGGGLDYIRGNLFDPTAMRPLAPDVSGPDNDLADLLDHYVLRAIEATDARMHLFGEPWSEPAVPDKIFGFAPGAGVHDIHMNQGNSPGFAQDDGPWQDGGLVIRLPQPDRWIAVFLAFQSQAWHTDDVTGHALDSIPEGVSPRPGELGGRMRIVAALVNPAGPPPEHETVTVINTRAEPVSLTGWSLADRLKARQPLPDLTVPPGEAVRLDVVPPVALGNSGGLITLLDPEGLKVDGVAYSRQEAGPDGWTIVF